MNSLRSLAARAGLGHFPAGVILVFITCLSVLAGAILISALQLIALGIAGGLLVALAQLEVLRAVANRRAETVNASLPQVVESLHSAVSAGIPILDAFADLASAGPRATRPVFTKAKEMAESGSSLTAILDWLKDDFGHYQADQLCELLRHSQSSGGMSLARNLGELADQIRTDAATLGEVQAKQGWVVGIAKLALATPWLVVAMLGTRPENAILYNSPTGLALLLGGLIACILAFAAIQRMAKLPEPRRVFV